MRSLHVECSDTDSQGNKVIPERALLYAILERALRDLTPGSDFMPRAFRNAVDWFRAKNVTKSTYQFTFEEIIEELQLTERSIELIFKLVDRSEKDINLRRQELDNARRNKLEAERKAHRIRNSTLARSKRLSYGPQNATIQWNSWYVRRSD